MFDSVDAVMANVRISIRGIKDPDRKLHKPQSWKHSSLVWCFPDICTYLSVLQWSTFVDWEFASLGSYTWWNRGRDDPRATGLQWRNCVIGFSWVGGVGLLGRRRRGLGAGWGVVDLLAGQREARLCCIL